MRIRNYTLSDIDLINDWLIKRDMAPVDPEDIPARGWIVMIDKKPVGAVFMRLCEGGYGIMDSLVNDPELPSEKRHLVNDRLFYKIQRFALANELKGVFGTTVDKGTLERAIRHGFSPSPMTLCVWRNEKVQ